MTQPAAGPETSTAAVGASNGMPAAAGQAVEAGTALQQQDSGVLGKSPLSSSKLPAAVPTETVDPDTLKAFLADVGFASAEPAAAAEVTDEPVAAAVANGHATPTRPAAERGAAEGETAAAAAAVDGSEDADAFADAAIQAALAKAASGDTGAGILSPLPPAVAAAQAAQEAAAAAAEGASMKRKRVEVPGGVDLQPYIHLAKTSGSQEALKHALSAQFPATRGRVAKTDPFRNLFATLLPDMDFTSRAGVLPHMAYKLWTLAGLPGGVPPRVYKPRSPKTDLAAAAPAALDGPSPPLPPAAGLGPAAGLVAAEVARQVSLAGSRSASHQATPGADVAAAAGGAELQPATGTTSQADQLAALHMCMAEHKREIVRLAALLRANLGVQRGQTVHLRMVLKTGILAGQQVRFQTRSGKVLSYGRLNAQASIDCFCDRCNGKPASASEFEEHSGSKDRRPADGIFMESTNISLKELLNLINSPELAAAGNTHMDACFACGTRASEEKGELAECTGCTASWHLTCAELDAKPEGEWYCKQCMAEGRTQPLPELPTPAAGMPSLGPSSKGGRVRAPPPPPKPSAGASAASSKPKRQKTTQQPDSSAAGATGAGGAAGGGGSGTGRVHMAAPQMAVRPRAMRQGRALNGHRLLFEGVEGGLVDGQKLEYRTTQGEVLLAGEAAINRPGAGSGIYCYHCKAVISCSAFEAHAGRGQRRAPYDNIFTEDGLTLKALAALLPGVEEGAGGSAGAGGDDLYGLKDVIDGCAAIVADCDSLAGGCTLCHGPDFQRGGFGPRTMLICEQCEREFHVGCLAKEGLTPEPLTALPEGDWYCSPECRRIDETLRAAVAAGQMEIPGEPGHTWQLTRGKNNDPTTTWTIRAAQQVLCESFDPIIDMASNIDLLPIMLYARAAGEYDYKNCHTMVLRHRGKPVVAAIMRVFGPQAAELPLIATKSTARRQGHARVLMSCFEQLIRSAGVRTLILPAAHESVETWKNGFGLVDMPEELVRLAKRQMHVLIFPGTEVLWKTYEDVPPPRGHHALREPPPRPPPAEIRAAAEVSVTVAQLLTDVCNSFGEAPPPGMVVIPVPMEEQEEEMAQQQQQHDAERALPAPAAGTGAEGTAPAAAEAGGGGGAQEQAAVDGPTAGGLTVAAAVEGAGSCPQQLDLADAALQDVAAASGAQGLPAPGRDVDMADADGGLASDGPGTSAAQAEAASASAADSEAAADQQQMQQEAAGLLPDGPPSKRLRAR